MTRIVLFSHVSDEKRKRITEHFSTVGWIGDRLIHRTVTLMKALYGPRILWVCHYGLVHERCADGAFAVSYREFEKMPLELVDAVVIEDIAYIPPSLGRKITVKMEERKKPTISYTYADLPPVATSLGWDAYFP